MAVEPYEPPTRYMPVGEDAQGDGGEEQSFAGLGGSFAGPMGQLTTRFLQARISGMNRATTSNQANQRAVMNSPEFAMAKALGISTPYNSGGSQIDPTRMAQRAQAPGMEGEFARKKLAEFNQRNQGEGILGAATGVAGLTKAPAAPRPAIQLPPESASPSLAPPQPIAPYGTPSATPPGSQPGPAAPAGAGKDEPAKPISPSEAAKATGAPIGAQDRPAPISPYGQPEMQAPTPQKETTKGPRLDTQRISDANDMRDAAIRAKDSTGDAREKKALQNQVNIAQDAREAEKKRYDTQVAQQANVEARNQKFFGNPKGPDGGKSFAEKPLSPLQPMGGFGAERIMTNKPAQSQAELEGRAAKYAADGERNRAAKEEGKIKAFREKRDTQTFPVKDKGKPTERGYAGPQPRYLGGGVIRRA